VTGLLYLPFAAANLPAHLPSAKVIAAVVVLALACTAVAFLVFFALIAEVGPNRALVITFVNPAVAVALGVVLLGESLTLGTVLGFPLILSGCVLATRRSRAVAVAEP
jgi:drug/metabolite transporter (DMT)-like permease